MGKIIVHVHDDIQTSKEEISSILVFTAFQPVFHTLASAYKRYYNNTDYGCCMINVKNDVSLVERILAPTYNNFKNVIMYSEKPYLPVVVHAIKLGASDFLQLPMKRQLLVSSIEIACKNHQNGLKCLLDKSDTSSKLTRLTLREHEVLNQILLGHRNKIIAYNLNLSQRTIENHRSRIMDKMSATSITHLVNMINKLKDA